MEEKIYNEIGINPTLINIGFGRYLKRKYKDEETKRKIINEIFDVYVYIRSFIDNSNKIYVYDMRRTTRNKIIKILCLLMDNITDKFKIKNLKLNKSWKQFLKKQIQRNKKQIRKINKELRTK
jgi:hypothetical protein